MTDTLRDVRIAGVGAYVPDKVLTNKDLETIVDTSDEWITTRTGIKERHIAEPDVPSSEIGVKAANLALERAGIKAEDLDAIIVPTITPDYIYPSTANMIQASIGAKNAFCFDIEAACSGFIYGGTIAKQFIATGRCDNVLVVCAETLSKITDWEDRNTCVLFGDGAGAAVFSPATDESMILSSFLGGNGDYANLLYLPGGGSKEPASKETVENRKHYMKMEGKEVFKAAVTAMGRSVEEAAKQAGISYEDIDLVIPHQANIRIIQGVAKFMGVGMEKVFCNIERYGNTSAASIVIALNEAYEMGRVQKGTTVAFVAFGGGFTWGACIVRF